MKLRLPKSIFPPLGDDANRRSIWRETKFLWLMLCANIIPFAEVIENFAEIARLLFVEKRRKPERVLQLVKTC